MFEPVIMFNLPEGMTPQRIADYIKQLQGEFDRQQSQQADDFQMLMERVAKLEAALGSESKTLEYLVYVPAGAEVPIAGFKYGTMATEWANKNYPGRHRIEEVKE